jgi:hypothetical protein
MNISQIRLSRSAVLYYHCKCRINPSFHNGSTCTSPSLVEYSRLVMYSFGFQHAFQRGLEPGDHIFFTKVRRKRIATLLLLLKLICVTVLQRGQVCYLAYGRHTGS